MKNWKLTYTAPANTWEEALPLGNGTLGAMTYGKLGEDRIRLNLDTLWSGYGKEKRNIEDKPDWKFIRKNLKEKHYTEAENYIKDMVLGDWTESYMPAGDLILRSENEQEIHKYYRELELNTALQTTSFENSSVKIKKEIFVSIDKSFLAVHMQADKPEITVQLTIESPLHYQFYDTTQMNQIGIEGQAPSYAAPNYYTCEEPIQYEKEKGIKFALQICSFCTEGRMQKKQNTIIIEKAKEIIIYLVGKTDYEMPKIDLKKQCAEMLNDIIKTDYWTLKEKHQKAFASYFNRIEFQLEGEEEEQERTTKEKLETFQEKEDLELAALLFHYGRYLLISSSKPGTQCANLQGIWNASMRPPWSSNYTVNINTEMNYWMAESCNLSEFHEPLIALIKKIAVKGKETAENLYGLSGWAAHHNVDIWEHTTPVGKLAEQENSCVYGMWMMSSGWLCRHLWEHYLYTQDKEFLKDVAFPLIKGAVEFYAEYLTSYDGYLVTMPSTSPENLFLGEDGKPHAVTIASTMDISILKDLFTYYQKICDILEVQDIYGIKEKLEQLPPWKIGKHGQLQEWYEDYEEADIQHRHISHLYGLYPADLISGENELENACKVTLNRRGDDGTGWCIAWKANLWARLKDGERAYQLLKKQLRFVQEEGISVSGGGTYANLFCAHPPFQIDGNFGYTAAVCEMLLQSHKEKIELLPAIPEKWKNGRAKGLKARGGFTIDLMWKEREVIEIKIKSIEPKEIVIKVNGSEKKIFIEKEYYWKKKNRT